MSNLYVLGGQQRKKQVDEWHQYQKGLVVRLDAASGEAEVCHQYVSPPDACAEGEPAILFKAGALAGDRLVVCTSTEVLVYEVPGFKLTGYISLPCFNDLHHAYPTPEGTIIVANTGLDMVVEVTLDGRVLNEWDVSGQQPWQRFSREIDYRKVVTTKPHLSHPNYIFRIGEEIWVTRFHQKDAISLNRPDRRIAIDIERPHDGVARNGFIYFTTVDGHLVIANENTLKIEEIIDLDRISNRDNRLLGWCRSVCVIDDRRVWVGFSAIRKTKFVEHISWVKHGFNHVRMPTRISLFDIFDKSCLKEIELESVGLNAVFSIIQEPSA
jgi:hypothetical protein